MRDAARLMDESNVGVLLVRLGRGHGRRRRRINLGGRTNDRRMRAGGFEWLATTDRLLEGADGCGTAPASGHLVRPRAGGPWLGVEAPVHVMRGRPSLRKLYTVERRGPGS